MEAPPQGYRRNVGICLINPSNKIFSASRIDIPGSWQMPQGGVDEREDTRVAAIRELREETGVTSAEIIGEAPHWLTYDFPLDVKEKLNKQWGTNWNGQAQKCTSFSVSRLPEMCRVAPASTHHSARLLTGFVFVTTVEKFAFLGFRFVALKWQPLVRWSGLPQIMQFPFGFFLKLGLKPRFEPRFLFRFTGNDEEINLSGDGTEKPEFEKWSWMTPQQVIELAVDFKKPVYEEVVKFFAQHFQSDAAAAL